MKTTNYKSIFSHSNCLSPEEMIKYRKKETTEAELRRIEEHLAQCVFCSEAVEDIDSFSAESIEEDLAELKKHSKTFSKSGGLNYSYILYAAALALIGISILINSSLHSHNRELFEEHFYSFPDITVHERGKINSGELFAALNLYRLKKYKKAHSIFDAILAETPNDTVYFYNGISLLAVFEPEEALKNFRHLTETGEGDFYEDALWYSALADVLLGEKDKAAEILRSIRDFPDYRQKAFSLLAELNDD